MVLEIIIMFKSILDILVNFKTELRKVMGKWKQNWELFMDILKMMWLMDKENSSGTRKMGEFMKEILRIVNSMVLEISSCLMETSSKANGRMAIVLNCKQSNQIISEMIWTIYQNLYINYYQFFAFLSSSLSLTFLTWID